MGTVQEFFFAFVRSKKKRKRKMKMLVAFVLFAALASSQALVWKSCGGSALKIKSLSVAQDPITFPGPVDAALEAETLQDMPAPIKVQLTLEKIGDDCKGAGILGDIIAESGLPCRCPLSKNPAVSVKNAHADLPKVPSFIAFLAEGKIDNEAKASDAAGNL